MFQFASSQAVINSAGGDSFSVGSVFYSSYESGNFQIFEGVLYAFKNDYELSISTLKRDDVKIFPNPFNDIILVNDAPLGLVQIYTTSGKLLIEREISDNKLIINTDGMSSGTYILKVLSNSGVINFKIVKQ